MSKQITSEEEAASKKATSKEKPTKEQKKQQLKLQKEEKKKQLLRDILNRETKYSELTLKRHEAEWRNILIKIALPELKNDLEYAWQNFERAVDCKNFQISLLMEELRQAEEQYMMKTKNHMEHMDKLIDMFHGRLEELKVDNDYQWMLIQKQSEEQTEEIKLTATEGENYLKTMLYVLEISKKQHKQNVLAEYFSKVQEGDTRDTQLVQRIRGILEKELFRLWRNSCNFINQYQEKQKERKHELDILKEQDDKMQNLLKLQLEKIRKAHEIIKTLKLQLLDCHTLLGGKLVDLQYEHDFFKHTFSALKCKLENDRQIDFNQLQLVTVNYNKTIISIQKLQKKGEHILHVAAVCRKLETQQEKVTPFPITKDMPEVCMKDVKDYLECMDLFWQRVAQADASRFTINEERNYLKIENQILKMRLHRYCQCLTCPPYNKTYKKKKGIYLTEAALEHKKYEKQLSGITTDITKRNQN